MEPWLSKLSAGDGHGAWDLFAERYRRLMLATIRRLVDDHDDVMEVFATVCQALSADDFARLRRYIERPGHTAGASTWLVAVVRNLTIDWLRARDGRTRRGVPTNLSPVQRDIYHAICIEGHSCVESYELIRARGGMDLPFRAFLREVGETRRLAPCPDDAPRPSRSHDPPPPEPIAPEFDPAETADAATRVADALASQPPDVRLAVELFVVERMSAGDVARVVGWPNAKAVYNRVYRALNALRAELERRGIGPGDL